MGYLATELAEKNVFQIVATSKKSEVEAFCKKHNLPVYPKKISSSLDLGFARHIARLAKEHQIQIVHTHDSHAHTFAVLAAQLFGLKASIVVSRRVDFAISKSLLSRYKYNHASIKKILCVSKTVADVLRPSIKNPEVMSVVYSGVDLGKFPSNSPGTLRKQYKIKPGTHLVGNVAAIADHKDYFTFVDTVEHLVNKDLNAHFFIIGDGPQRNEIEAYIQKKNLVGHITLTGFRTDIVDILPELDVFLFTSKTEGLGTSLLDAFCAKVPVVATKAGGASEIVIHRQTGLACEVKEHNCLAEQVWRVIKDGELRHELVKNAYELAKAFSKENMAKQTLKHYEEICNK